jgi:hypothetical protein
MLETMKPRMILRWPASEQPTWKKDQHEQYRKISDALTGWALRGRESAPRRLRKPKEETEQSVIDICQISAAAFCLNLKKKENMCFAISILKIDHELEARTPDLPESDPTGARRSDETEFQ